MTWFGILLVCYWIFSIGSSFYVLGRGGMYVTRGNAWFGILLAILLLVGLLTVGTGTP